MNLLPIPENLIDAVQNRVWDFIRKKYVRLTPEERVRQSLIHTLVKAYQYPASLIGLEKKINYGKQTKRYDLLLYSKTGKPLLLAECKSPTTKLNKNSILQLGIYNSTLAARYLLLTNGIEIILVDSHNAQVLKKILPFSALENS